MNMYEFIEPHKTGGHSRVIISEDNIIKYMKEYVSPKKTQVLTDEELIDSFCVDFYAIRHKDLEPEYKECIIVLNDLMKDEWRFTGISPTVDSWFNRNRLFLNKIEEKLKGFGEHSANESLLQSIEHNWQTVYELKEQLQQQENPWGLL